MAVVGERLGAPFYPFLLGLNFLTGGGSAKRGHRPAAGGGQMLQTHSREVERGDCCTVVTENWGAGCLGEGGMGVPPWGGGRRRHRGAEGPLTDSQGLWLLSQRHPESSGGSARPSPGRSWTCWRLFSLRPATPISSCERRWP